MTAIEIRDQRLHEIKKALETASTEIGYIMHVVHEMCEEEEKK